MRYRLLKDIGLCLAVVFLFIMWYKNVMERNRRYEVPKKYYYMGETLIYDDWSIIPFSRSEIMDGNTFKNAFDVKNVSVSMESKYMCLTLKVEKLSENCNMDTFLEAGFRSDTWSNGIDPFLFYDINSENLSKIEEEGKGILYIPVDFFPDNWKKNRYRNLEQENFRYVISVYPVTIEIVL